MTVHCVTVMDSNKAREASTSKSMKQFIFATREAALACCLHYSSKGYFVSNIGEFEVKKEFEQED